MRRYETIAIFDPDLSENQRSAIFERVQDLIPKQGGLLAFIDVWGARQLAYQIDKKERGYYVRFDYCGPSAVVDEMERSFRIDEGILKYMTVLTDEDPDMDSIQEEIARLEAEKATTAESGAMEASEPPADETPQDDSTHASEPLQSETAEDESTRASEPAETETIEDETPPLQSEEEKE